MKTSRNLRREARELLADSAVFLGVGATMGALGALSWTSEARWPALVLAALALSACLVLRGRLAIAARYAVDWALGQAHAQVDARPAERPLQLLGPALGVALAAWIVDAQGAVAWAASAIAASLAVAGVFAAAARLAAPILEDVVDLDSRLGPAAARLTSRLAAVAIAAVGATAVLEIWGAPAMSAAIALGLLGLAAAIALRDQLRDVAAGLALENARRIRVGDHVEVVGVDGLSGLVVEIGLRTIRLVREDGAIIDAPNASVHQAATIVRPAAAPETAFPAASEDASDGAPPPAPPSSARRGEGRAAADNGVVADLIGRAP